MSSYIIPSLSFIAAALGVYAIAALMNPYRVRLKTRVDAVCNDGSGHGASNLVSDSADGEPTGWLFFLQRLAPRRAEGRAHLEQQLNRAGIYTTTAMTRYYAAQVFSAGAAMFATYLCGMMIGLRFDLAIVVALAAGGAGLLMPWVWLRREIHRYHLMLQSAIPDFLDLMIVCLEGGMSLQQTILRVSDELRVAHPALAVELKYVQRDMELGSTVDQSLKRFADRCDYEGVRTLSTFVREAKRFGTNMTEAMRSHADMLRSQREQAAEENAQKASVKILLPTLLLIFPAIFVVAVGPAIIQIFEAFSEK